MEEFFSSISQTKPSKKQTICFGKNRLDILFWPTQERLKKHIHRNSEQRFSEAAPALPDAQVGKNEKNRSPHFQKQKYCLESF